MFPPSPFLGGAIGPRFINRGWRGLPGQVDAAMVGRIYVKPSSPKRQSRRRSSRRHRRKYRSQRRWGRWNAQFWDWPGEPSSESSDLDWLLDGTTHCQPFQSVYFFVGGELWNCGSTCFGGRGFIHPQNLPAHSSDSQEWGRLPATVEFMVFLWLIGRQTKGSTCSINQKLSNGTHCHKNMWCWVLSWIPKVSPIQGKSGHLRPLLHALFVSPLPLWESCHFCLSPADKYYRVNLRTRRVDWVYPKYPRPIAKYWLGCPSDEDLA